MKKVGDISFGKRESYVVRSLGVYARVGGAAKLRPDCYCWRRERLSFLSAHTKLPVGGGSSFFCHLSG